MAGKSAAKVWCTQVEEDVEVEKGVVVGRVVSVSRQHRHTLEHTGLMRWESSLPLARFLLALPTLTQGMLPSCLTVKQYTADFQRTLTKGLTCCQAAQWLRGGLQYTRSFKQLILLRLTVLFVLQLLLATAACRLHWPPVWLSLCP